MALAAYGTQLRLDFEYSLVLILLPVCAAVVFIVWRASRTYMPPIGRRISLGLRLGVGSLLVPGLASPLVQLTADQLGVAVLLDRSDSVAPAARMDEETWLASALVTKGANDQLAVVSFSEDATLERS